MTLSQTPEEISLSSRYCKYPSLILASGFILCQGLRKLRAAYKNRKIYFQCHFGNRREHCLGTKTVQCKAEKGCPLTSSINTAWHCPGDQTSNGCSSICALAQATVERPFGVDKAKPQGHQQMLVPRAAPPESAPEQIVSPNTMAENVRIVVKEKGNENGLQGLKGLYL